MGDCTIGQALRASGGRIALEGNIEINDLLSRDEGYIREFLEHTVQAAYEYADGRFILCPSAGYMEYIEPSEMYIDNLITYVNHSVALSKKYAG